MADPAFSGDLRLIDDPGAAPRTVDTGARGPHLWTTAQLVGGLALALLAGLAIGYGRSPKEMPTGVASSATTSPLLSPTTVDLAPLPGMAMQAQIATVPPTTMLAASEPTMTGPTTTVPTMTLPTVATHSSPTSRAAPLFRPPTTTGGDSASEADASGAPSSGGLLLHVRSTGSGRTARFNVAAPGWQLGWGYDCSRSAGSSRFEVTVLNEDGGPAAAPPLRQTRRKAAGIERYSSVGPRMLQISTQCAWEIKVVGSSG